jgi:hypothetical protein
MSGFVIPCPKCGKELKVPDRSFVGKKGKCRQCATTFVLTEPSEEEVELELVSPAEPGPPPAEHSAPIPAGSPSEIALSVESGGVSRMKELQRKNRKRRNVQIVVGGLLAVVIAGSFFYLKGEKERIDRQERERLARLAEQKKPQRDEQYVSNRRQLEDNKELADRTAPTRGAPITLNYMPPGVRIVINLHPAEFWREGSLAEEVRFCLGTTFNDWFSRQVQELTGFEPSRIERLMLGIIPGLRGEPPQVAGYVELVEPQKKFDMIKLFQGERINDYEPAIYMSGNRCFLHIDDRTFAFGPQGEAQNMADAIDFNALTSEDVTALLSRTDRERHLTILFDPKLVRLEQETYFPEPMLGVLNHVLDWIGDDVRALSWALHFEDRFHSELKLRNDPVTTKASLQSKLQKRLDEAPHHILSAVEKMNPAQVGKRKVIGRFPAMMKAFALSTLGGSGKIEDQLVQFTTVLHERAAPNLALGTVLVWDQSTRTDFERTASAPPPAAVAETTPPPRAITLEEKLQQKIEIDFRKTALQDAFAYISGESRIPIVLDGDALKAVGFTQNMNQDMNLGEVTVQEALLAIMKGKGHKIIEDNPDTMILILDEQGQSFTVSAVPYATDRGFKPYEFK